MYTKQPKDNRGYRWEYLPDTNTLLKYLNRKDLMELSKCCKRYRKQLEHRVLEKSALETSIRNKRELYYELLALNLF
jgi:hypothetical protein